MTGRFISKIVTKYFICKIHDGENYLENCDELFLE